MSFDRLKKFSSGSSTQPENPYAKKTTTKASTTSDSPAALTDVEKEVLRSSLLEGQNKHLYSRILVLEGELKELREDITTLYSIIMGEDDSDITPTEARDKYFKFRTDKRHILNRRGNGQREEKV